MKGYQSPALLRVWVFCSQRQLVPKEVKLNSSLWLGTCNRAELVLTLCSRSSEQPHYRQEKQIRGNISTETAGQFQGHKPIWTGSGLAPPPPTVIMPRPSQGSHSTLSGLSIHTAYIQLIPSAALLAALELYGLRQTTL